MQRTPFGISAYRLATGLLTPVAPLLLKRRSLHGKENEPRAGERLGRPTRPRPPGKLIWVHGASVGECVAALPLIDALIARLKLPVMVTSGTVTSAEVMAERLPQGAFHQFIPIDTPAATRGFLDYWRPQIGLFVDSDIWPNLVLGAKARGVPLVLINARMSSRSYEGWNRVPKSAAALLGCFEACLAQDDEIAERFLALKTPNVRVIGSLKADAAPLPADDAELAVLRCAIGNRPVFLAAQTHPGEEETLLPAHDILRKEFSDLLTVVVPRHPQRGTAIAALCGTRKSALRSRRDKIAADTAVYIADTIGELGLFYRLARFAFVGGSLIRHGGQNPMEPAKLGCGVLAGPHTFNFTTAYEAIVKAQGMGRVETAGEIAVAAGALLADPEKAQALGAKAKEGAKSLCGAVAETAALVEKMLNDAHA
jgi:3-deoxy-D-manno-octulosonic-acid transferase